MTTLAITGIPNSGKSSVFAALTGRYEGIAPFPFSTTVMRVGMLAIEDPELEELGRLEGSDRVTRASVEVVDTPPRYRSGGETDRETIGKIRQADCLVVVLRAFGNPAAPGGESEGNPARQVEETILDLALNDADVFEGSLPRLRNQATSRPERRQAYRAAARATEITGEGRLLRSVQWSDRELKALGDFAPLTLKPLVWVINAEEDHLHEHVDRVKEATPSGDPVVAVTAALEAEASALDPEDRTEMREAFGLGDGAAATIGRAALEALDLGTFFTANRRETRAWLTPVGSSARQAAGKVHSDMQRGFIRAEVADAPEVIRAGGWDAARRQGVVRVEGRDYPVQPGDVLQIRFSV